MDIMLADGFEEAEEFFEFNVVGAYVGRGTPCFVRMMVKEDALEWAQESSG